MELLKNIILCLTFGSSTKCPYVSYVISPQNFTLLKEVKQLKLY
jgi:hypothetical protein